MIKMLVFFQNKHSHQANQPDGLESAVTDAINAIKGHYYKSGKRGSDTSLSYIGAIISYIKNLERARKDFSDRIPGKFVNIFPASYMGGVLGFTYIGDTFMGWREDLTGETKKMVDIHESIHTNDEYETRILTDWIMSEEKDLY